MILEMRCRNDMGNHIKRVDKDMLGEFKETDSQIKNFVVE